VPNRACCDIFFERFAPLFRYMDNAAMEDTNIPSDADLELPAELRRAIVDIHSPPIPVPAHLDRLILSAAHVRLARRKRAARILRWGSVAAAAVVLLAVARFTLMEKPHTPQVAIVGDVNGDGRVNILDAFVVARAIAHHEQLPPAWDVNGDGVVDQKDVDLLAQMAVNVSKGPKR
jgi:hypothetical protein